MTYRGQSDDAVLAAQSVVEQVRRVHFDSMISHDSNDFFVSELRMKLRRLRVQRGLSTRVLGLKTGFSQAKISKLENGQRPAKPDDVRRILEVLDVRAEIVESLVQQAEALRSHREPRTVAPNGQVIDFHIAGELEAVAREHLMMEDRLIPLWLQTPSYMECVHRSHHIPISRREFVRGKLVRRRASESVRRHHSVIISEEVLHRQVLSTSDWLDQLHYIQERMCRPGIELGVLPEGSLIEPFVSWLVHDAKYVCYEGIGPLGILEGESAAVRLRMDQFEQNADLAVWGGAAIKLIRSAIARCEERDPA